MSLASEQDGNALFYQIMCVLHGNDFAVAKNQLSPYEAFFLLFLTKFPIHDRIYTQTYTLDRADKMCSNYANALFCTTVQKGVYDCMVLLVSERNGGKGQCCFNCGKQTVLMVSTEL